MNNIAIFVSENLFFCIAFIFVLIMFIVFEISQSKNSKISLTPENAVIVANRGKGVYIDIRKKEDFNKSHILNAKHVEVQNLEQSLKKLVKNKANAVVLYGDNADKIVTKLRKDGYENSYTINGGINAWKASGFPVRNI